MPAFFERCRAQHSTERTRSEVRSTPQLWNLYNSHWLCISHLLPNFYVFLCYDNGLMWYRQDNFHFPCWLIWFSISRRAVWLRGHVSHPRLLLAECFQLSPVQNSQTQKSFVRLECTVRTYGVAWARGKQVAYCAHALCLATTLTITKE
jgi:hypothetical protein